MRKRIVSLTLAFAIFCSLCGTALAHNKVGAGGHDETMSLVLFGSRSYKEKLDVNSKQYTALVALENAVALCLDQYNGYYEAELASLKTFGVHGLPKNIGEINFKESHYHRRYTHRGWNYSYSVDKGNWQVRKTILLQTVNKVFGFQNRAGQWQTIWGLKDYGYSKKCEAFAELLYYIHILWDIDSASMDDGYSSMIKLALAHPSETDSDDIYSELLELLPILFASQTSSVSYTGLMADLKTQANAARSFVKDTPDIKSNYAQYKEYAKVLLEKLESKIPSLLQNEPFFTAVFDLGSAQKAA